MRSSRFLAALAAFAPLSFLGGFSSSAHAVPSFARQTGQECAACHVGAYGPQLTPYGVKFKLGGYTDTDGKGGKVPISAMLVGAYTHTEKSQDEPPAPHTNRNDNWTVDEASVFLAGRLSDHAGAFVQATYDGVEQRTAMDQMDLRLVQTVELGGKDTVLGLSVNNNPGVQDAFNTMPVWAFPYVTSPVGFSSGDAATLINGGLEQRVTGVSAYAFWDNSLYAEVGTYRALSQTAQSKLGLGREDDPGRLGGNTAYWRLAWMQGMKKQAFQAGVFGLHTEIQPDHQSSGPTNKYNDIGVDASYQFLGTREHVGTVYTSYIWENTTNNAFYDSGEAANRSGSLNEFKLNASYYYQQTYGLTVGRFMTQGKRDTLLYGDGYANGSPNTSGYLLQADWTPWGKEGSWGAPWANLRLGAQYSIFDKFNGASHNYDGNGRDAKDNNTLFVFAWTSF